MRIHQRMIRMIDHFFDVSTEKIIIIIDVFTEKIIIFDECHLKSEEYVLHFSLLVQKEETERTENTTISQFTVHIILFFTSRNNSLPRRNNNKDIVSSYS